MLGAGLPQSVGAVTLSKMCGSGMRAMMFAHDMLHAGTANVMVAGGMESMTNAPHLTFMRKGVKYGITSLYDHMATDGLEDAYEKLPGMDGKPGAGKAMGVFAEECVAKYRFSREQMDAFSIASTQRAKKANEDGSFDWEIAPVTLPGKAGDIVVKFDEQPFKGQARQDPGPEAGVQEGRHDHRGQLVEHLRRRCGARADAREHGRQLGVQPLAAILGHTVHAQAPNWFSTAPVGAIEKLLKKTGWAAKDVDLWRSTKPSPR